MTKAQAADAIDKAKTSKDGALKAIRAAWAHVLYPEKDASSVTGSAFSLEHLSIVSKERGPIPAAVYDKLKADGAILERLGPDRLWLALQPIWPEDRPHIPISELLEWFQSYVYMPKIRDRVALDQAIRDAVGKLDAQFGYADGYDNGVGKYLNPMIARTPPELFPGGAVSVARTAVPTNNEQVTSAPPPTEPNTAATDLPAVGSVKPLQVKAPSRFYGSVEIDVDRPVKAFDAIINAVVMELQRNPTTKLKITVEIEATAVGGFSESDIGVVRDNARQLKFKPESTGFGD